MGERDARAPGVRLTGRAPGRFEQIDLSADGGCWTALLGRSGVGKSSVLAAIAGLLDSHAFHGSVAADDGSPLSDRVAWMAQDPLLPPWLDAIDAVSMGDRLRGRRPDRDRAAHALADVGLAGFERRRPDALSGGQRQRVALARTLYEDRPVVLLDEPFSALDALTRSDVQDLAAERLSGRTVLHVTHDPTEAARLAHAAVVLGPRGARRIALAGAPPRPTYAPETLAAAAGLEQELRAQEEAGRAAPRIGAAP